MRWVGTEIDDSDYLGDVSDSIHVDVCPECGMPFHGHGLDPPPHHQCKVDYEDAVPALYVPAFKPEEINALLSVVLAYRLMFRVFSSEALGSGEYGTQAGLEAGIARLEQMRDELDADADGPYACTGADYHDPNCGGTCGAG